MRKIVKNIRPEKEIHISLLDFDSTNVVAYKTGNPETGGYWAVLCSPFPSPHSHSGFVYMRDFFKADFSKMKFVGSNMQASIEKAICAGREVIWFDDYEELCEKIMTGEC